MKQFIEEYGLVILAVFAISTLIVIATPLKFVIADWIDIALGTNVKTQENWANKNNTYKVKIIINQVEGDTVEAECQLNGPSTTDVFILEYQVIDRDGKQSKWEKDDTSGNPITLNVTPDGEAGKTFTVRNNVDEGQLRVRVRNSGLDDNYWIYSQVTQIKGSGGRE